MAQIPKYYKPFTIVHFWMSLHFFQNMIDNVPILIFKYLKNYESEKQTYYSCDLFDTIFKMIITTLPWLAENIFITLMSWHISSL